MASGDDGTPVDEENFEQSMRKIKLDCAEVILNRICENADKFRRLAEDAVADALSKKDYFHTLFKILKNEYSENALTILQELASKGDEARNIMMAMDEVKSLAAPDDLPGFIRYMVRHLEHDQALADAILKRKEEQHEADETACKKEMKKDCMTRILAAIPDEIEDLVTELKTIGAINDGQWQTLNQLFEEKSMSEAAKVLAIYLAEPIEVDWGFLESTGTGYKSLLAKLLKLDYHHDAWMLIRDLLIGDSETEKALKDSTMTEGTSPAKPVQAPEFIHDVMARLDNEPGFPFKIKEKKRKQKCRKDCLQYILTKIKENMTAFKYLITVLTGIKVLTDEEAASALQSCEATEEQLPVDIVNIYLAKVTDSLIEQEFEWSANSDFFRMFCEVLKDEKHSEEIAVLHFFAHDSEVKHAILRVSDGKIGDMGDPDLLMQMMTEFTADPSFVQRVTKSRLEKPKGDELSFTAFQHFLEKLRTDSLSEADANGHMTGPQSAMTLREILLRTPPGQMSSKTENVPPAAALREILSYITDYYEALEKLNTRTEAEPFRVLEKLLEDDDKLKKASIDVDPVMSAFIESQDLPFMIAKMLNKLDSRTAKEIIERQKFLEGEEQFEREFAEQEKTQVEFRVAIPQKFRFEHASLQIKFDYRLPRSFNTKFQWIHAREWYSLKTELPVGVAMNYELELTNFGEATTEKRQNKGKRQMPIDHGEIVLILANFDATIKDHDRIKAACKLLPNEDINDSSVVGQLLIWKDAMRDASMSDKSIQNGLEMWFRGILQGNRHSNMIFACSLLRIMERMPGKMSGDILPTCCHTFQLKEDDDPEKLKELLEEKARMPNQPKDEKAPLHKLLMKMLFWKAKIQPYADWVLALPIYWLMSEGKAVPAEKARKGLPDGNEWETVRKKTKEIPVENMVILARKVKEAMQDHPWLAKSFMNMTHTEQLKAILEDDSSWRKPSHKKMVEKLKWKWKKKSNKKKTKANEVIAKHHSRYYLEQKEKAARSSDTHEIDESMTDCLVALSDVVEVMENAKQTLDVLKIYVENCVWVLEWFYQLKVRQPECTAEDYVTDIHQNIITAVSKSWDMQTFDEKVLKLWNWFLCLTWPNKVLQENWEKSMKANLHLYLPEVLQKKSEFLKIYAEAFIQDINTVAFQDITDEAILCLESTMEDKGWMASFMEKHGWSSQCSKLVAGVFLHEIRSLGIMGLLKSPLLDVMKQTGADKLRKGLDSGKHENKRKTMTDQIGEFFNLLKNYQVIGKEVDLLRLKERDLRFILELCKCPAHLFPQVKENIKKNHGVVNDYGEYQGIQKTFHKLMGFRYTAENEPSLGDIKEMTVIDAKQHLVEHQNDLEEYKTAIFLKEYGFFKAACEKTSLGTSHQSALGRWKETKRLMQKWSTEIREEKGRLKKRLEEINAYFSLLSLEKMLSHIEKIFEPVREIEMLKEVKPEMELKHINDRKTDAIRKIQAFDADLCVVLEEFLKGEELTNWLRKDVQDTSEAKVMCDLTMLSATPQEVGKVSKFMSAVNGFEPILFATEGATTLDDVVNLLTRLKRNIVSGSDLAKQWTDTAEDIEWFREISERFSAGEKKFLKDVQRINKKGTYHVEYASTDGNIPKIEDCLWLEIQDETSETKRMSLTDLEKLKTSILLLSIDVEDKEHFIMLLATLKCLAKELMNLIACGCALFTDLVAEIRPQNGGCLQILVRFTKSGDYAFSEGTSPANLEKLAKVFRQIAERQKAYVKQKRKEYYFLNCYTMQQTSDLCRQLALFRERDQADINELMDLLHTATKMLYTNEDIIDETLQEAMKKSSASEEKKAVQLLVKEFKLKQNLATAAVQKKGCDHEECLDWAFENQNNNALINRLCDDFYKQYGYLSEESNWSARKIIQQDIKNYTLECTIQNLQQKYAECGKSLSKTFSMIADEYHKETSNFTLTDRLNLDHLGEFLYLLRQSTLPSPPAYLLQGPQIASRPISLPKQGSPNLIVLPEKAILSKILDLYKNSPNNPLPTATEILICSGDTTEDEVERFMRRAMCKNDMKGQPIYCLAFSNKLRFEVMKAVENMYHCLEEDESTLDKSYQLFILTSARNDYVSTCFMHYHSKLDTSVKVTELRRYLIKQLPLSPSISRKLNDHHCSVQVVKSQRSGVGKSLFIERLKEQMRANIQEQVLEEATIVRLLHTKTDVDAVVTRLRDSTKNTKASKLIHIDFASITRIGIEQLLFKLFVLGSVQHSTGKIWLRRSNHLYALETTILDEDDLDERHMMMILPAVNCVSPKQALDALNGDEQPEEHDTWDKAILYNQKYQQPFQYLRCLETRHNLDAFQYDERKCGSTVEVLKSLIKHSHMSDPSWAQLASFSSFLSYQLENVENSSFLNADVAQENLPGLKKFALESILKTARDLASSSLLGHSHDTNSEFDVHQLKDPWNPENQPYFFFNDDRQTMTFLNVHFDRFGRLINDKDPTIRYNESISGNLATALIQAKCFELSNIDQLERKEKLRLLHQLMDIQPVFAEKPDGSKGQRLFDPDPDPTYELTSDNILKIIAIHVRLKCNIPLVVMGDTGCGKTRMIEFICKLKSWRKSSIKNLVIVKIHGGVSVREFYSKVRDAQKTAMDNLKKFPGSETIVFFDEANTTLAVHAIKEVICDGTMNGEHFDADSMRFIAACNPYQKLGDDEIERLNKCGLGFCAGATRADENIGKVPLRHLVYRVVSLPLAMQELVWNFGKLTQGDEKIYTEQMVQKLADRFHNERAGRQQEKHFDENFMKLMASLISKVQSYMRRQKDECKYVSLRDTERCMDVYEWLHNHSGLFQHVQGTKEIFSSNPSLRLLLHTVSICYRASIDKKREFSEMLAKTLIEEGFSGITAQDLDAEIKAFQNLFNQDIEKDSNITCNEALRENVFMMAICIDLKIPLFLIGKPGSSKSLAKTIIQNNMTRKLPVYEELSECSSLTEASGIEEVFSQCVTLQNTVQSNYTAVVVLDEIGLAEASPNMPLKILHPLLEFGTTEGKAISDTASKQKVGFIAISNWAIDPAKMNRGIFVTRQMPECDDLAETAQTIFKQTQLSKSFANDSKNRGNAVQEAHGNDLEEVDSFQKPDVEYPSLVQVETAGLKQAEPVEFTDIDTPETLDSASGIERVAPNRSMDSHTTVAQKSNSGPEPELYTDVNLDSEHSEPGNVDFDILSNDPTDVKASSSSHEMASSSIAFVGVAEEADSETPYTEALRDSMSGWRYGWFQGSLTESSSESMSPTSDSSDSKFAEYQSNKQPDNNTIIRALTKGYLKVERETENDKESRQSDFFGLRDFYYLVKSVASSCPEGEIISARVLKYAIVKNFSGSEQPISHIFWRKLADVGINQPVDEMCTKELIQSNLKDDQSRFLLLLTEHFSAFWLLEWMLDEKPAAEFVFGSNFEEDQDYGDLCEDIRHLKSCMVAGKTVVLINQAKIHESLYDVLNQHYAVFKKKRYVDIGLGGHRAKCTILYGFRLIIIEQKDVVYRTYPAPLVNRLEKYHFNSKVFPRHQDFQKLLCWTKAFSNVQKASFEEKDVFAGYFNDTVGSLMLMKGFEQKSAENSLIHAATCDAIFRLEKSDLDKAEIDCIWKTYFGGQMHDSLAHFLMWAIQLKKNKEGVPLFYDVVSFSPFLTGKDQNRIEKKLEDNNYSANLTILSLEEFKKRQEYTERVSQYFERSGSDNKGKEDILLIQCQNSQNSELIEFARFLLKKKMQILDENQLSSTVVAFVLSTERPRSAANASKQLALQFSRHSDVVYVDELKVQRDFPCSPSLMHQQPLSEVIRNALTQDDFRLSNLFHQSIFGCASKILTARRNMENANQYLECISSALRKEDVFRVLSQKIIHLVKEKETDSCSLWSLQEAMSKEKLLEGGSLSNTLYLHLEKLLTDLLAFIVSSVDHGGNLKLALSGPDWIPLMWQEIFEDFDISWREMKDRHSPVMPCSVPNQSCEFPFSFWLTLKFSNWSQESNFDGMLKRFQDSKWFKHFRDFVRNTENISDMLMMYIKDIVVAHRSHFLPILNEAGKVKIHIIQKFIHRVTIQKYRGTASVFPGAFIALRENLDDFRHFIEVTSIVPALEETVLGGVMDEVSFVHLFVRAFEKMLEHLADRKLLENGAHSWMGFAANAINLSHLLKDSNMKSIERLSTVQFVHHFLHQLCPESNLEKYYAVLQDSAVNMMVLHERNMKKPVTLILRVANTLQSCYEDVYAKILMYWKDTNCSKCDSRMSEIIRLQPCGHCLCSACWGKLSKPECHNCGKKPSSHRLILPSRGQEKELENLKANSTAFLVWIIEWISDTLTQEKFDDKEKNEFSEFIFDEMVVIEGRKKGSKELNKTALDLNMATRSYVLHVLFKLFPTYIEKRLNETFKRRTAKMFVQAVLDYFQSTITDDGGPMNAASTGDLNSSWEILQNPTNSAVKIVREVSKIRHLLRKLAKENEPGKEEIALPGMACLQSGSEATAQNYLIKCGIQLYGKSWCHHLAQGNILRGHPLLELLKAPQQDLWCLSGGRYARAKTKFATDSENIQLDMSVVADCLACIHWLKDKDESERTSLAQASFSISGLKFSTVLKAAAVGHAVNIASHEASALFQLIVSASMAIATKKPLENFRIIALEPSAGSKLCLPTMPQHQYFNIPVTHRREDGRSVYECPDGHLYTVDNCTNPTEQSKCPECKKIIGGIDHRPATGNKRVRVEESTQRGYLLNPVPSNSDDPTMRMTRQGVPFTRFILHTSLLLGLCHKPASIQAMIGERMTENECRQYLATQLLKDIRDLSVALDHNVDETALIMHKVLLKEEGQDVHSTFPSWTSVDERVNWERKFQDEFVAKHIFQTDHILNEVNGILKAQEDALHSLLRNDGGQNYDQVHLTWDCPLLWMPLKQPSVEHILQSALETGKGKALRALLSEDHRIELLPLLEAVIQLQEAFVTRYQNRLDLNEAEKKTFQDVNLTDEEEIWLDDYIYAWNQIFPTLRAKFAREYFVEMSEASPISMALPSDQGRGHCAKLLVRHLARLHNDFLDSAARNFSVKEASIDQLSHSHFIRFDRKKDMLPLIKKHMKYEVVAGDNDYHISYNVEALEKQVLEKYVRYKRKVKIESLPNIEYLQDIGIGKLWANVLETNGPQEPMSGRMSEEITALISNSSFSMVCSAVRDLTHMMCFLATIKQDLNQTLSDYLEKTLRLSTERTSIIPKSAQIQHALALYSYFAWYKCIRFAMNDPSLHSIYPIDDKANQASISEGMKHKLLEMFDKIDVCLFTKRLNDAMLQVYCNPDIPVKSDWSLRDQLFETLEFEYPPESEVDETWLEMLPSELTFSNMIELFSMAVKFQEEEHGTESFVQWMKIGDAKD